MAQNWGQRDTLMASVSQGCLCLVHSQIGSPEMLGYLFWVTQESLDSDLGSLALAFSPLSQPPCQPREYAATTTLAGDTESLFKTGAK